MSRPEPGIDLSPLDPEHDPELLDRVVQRVLDRLGPGVVEDPPSLLTQVAESYARWFRPLLAAASVIAIAAGARLVMDREQGADVAPTAQLVEVPSDWASWIATGASPATEDLLLSFTGERR